MHVKIYIRDCCKSCKEALNYFKEKNIDIELINVTYDQEKFQEIIELGAIATPVIIINGEIFYSLNDKMKKVWSE